MNDGPSKGKIIFWSVLGLVAIVGLVMLIWGFSTGFQYFTADVRGEVEKTELTAGSGEFRIFSYDYFFNKCAAIQNAEVEYDAQYGLLQSMEPGTDRDSRTRYDRQRRVVAVQLANIEQLKNQYNVDAAKEETIGQFRDSDLPSRVSTQPHKPGDRTRCTF